MGPPLSPRSPFVLNPFGAPVPLGLEKASGARVGRNPSLRARSVARTVRLAPSFFCVPVIGFLALANGTSARGLCCVGGSPSRRAVAEVSASCDSGVCRVGSAGLLGELDCLFGDEACDSNVRSSEARVCCPPGVFIGEKRTGPMPPPRAAMLRPRTLGGDGDSSALGPSPPSALSTMRPNDLAGWIGDLRGGSHGWTTRVVGSSRARSSSLALARFLLTNCLRRACVVVFRWVVVRLCVGRRLNLKTFDDGGRGGHVRVGGARVYRGTHVHLLVGELVLVQIPRRGVPTRPLVVEHHRRLGLDAVQRVRPHPLAGLRHLHRARRCIGRDPVTSRVRPRLRRVWEVRERTRASLCEDRVFASVRVAVLG